LRGGSPDPPCARQAIAWANACLKNDPTIRADAKRLRTVRQTDREAFCIHYKA